MIELYICNTNDITVNCSTLSQVSRTRKNLILSYKQTDDQLRSLAAGLLLTKALGKNCEDTFLYNPYGKPFLSNNVYFNLSHSGEYTVLAVSDHLVGIDIEKHETIDFFEIAKISFHPDEIQLLTTAKDTVSTFYSLWTLKESYIKYLGTGFSLESASFSISFTEFESAYLRKLSPECYISLPYDYSEHERPVADAHFIQIRSLPGYSLSICSPVSEPQLIIADRLRTQ